MILARCDASLEIGSGHVMRTLAIVEEALSRGHNAILSGTIPAHLSPIVDEITRLRLRTVPAVDDALSLAALAGALGADLVHLDSYSFPMDARQRLSAEGIVLSNMEDETWGRRPADVVVDTTHGIETAPRPDDGSRLLLRGSTYIPLRRSIRDAARKARPKRPLRPEVLVVMGGTDAAGLNIAAVRAVAATGVSGQIHVVSANRDQRAALMAMATEDLQVHALRPTAAMPELMARATVVVSAAGTTIWELCCIGTPMAVIEAVQNQHRGYITVTGAGAAIGLGTSADVIAGQSNTPDLRKLLTDEQTQYDLTQRARSLVDCSGSAKLLDAFEGLVGQDGARSRRKWLTRPAAASDARTLLTWRNDPTSRINSRSESLIAWSEHLYWFSEVIRSSSHNLYIVECDGHAIGAVRWDVDPHDIKSHEVSIMVAPEQRGNKFGLPLLVVGERALLADKPYVRRAIATIYNENIRSRRLFERAGYQITGSTDSNGFVTYLKDLIARS